MQITTKTDNHTLIATLSGELDHHSAENIRSKIELDYSRNNSKNLILDFSNVSFMDSSGIGMIIGRYKNVKIHGGEMYICAINPAVKKLFDISALDKIVKVFDTLEEALRGSNND